jgi:hypothetical protein
LIGNTGVPPTLQCIGELRTCSIKNVTDDDSVQKSVGAWMLPAVAALVTLVTHHFCRQHSTQDR